MRKDVATSVIIVPPREFGVPSEWYYIVQKVRNGKIGEITYGMTSVQNVINFCPAILQL
jgi:predicted RNA-binding protein with EMAP domain